MPRDMMLVDTKIEIMKRGRENDKSQKKILYNLPSQNGEVLRMQVIDIKIMSRTICCIKILPNQVLERWLSI